MVHSLKQRRYSIRPVARVRLLRHPDHPNRVAISDADSFVVDGIFFLDFTRPLEHRRWFGIRNRFFGYLCGLLVPVVHQCESAGGFVVGVHRSDPRFAELRALWKRHYPAKRILPTAPAEGLKIIADFAKQFPGDCRSPAARLRAGDWNP